MSSRTHTFAKIGIVALLVIIFAIYGFYRARNFLTGPVITIESPQKGQTFSDSYIEVKGTAKNVAMIFLNGRQIYTDKQGHFKENLLLIKGYNIIELSAKDKFNREIKDTREIVLK